MIARVSTYPLPELGTDAAATLQGPRYGGDAHTQIAGDVAHGYGWTDTHLASLSDRKLIQFPITQRQATIAKYAKGRAIVCASKLVDLCQ